MSLLLAEEFCAPQGEGPSMGRPMYWLRLGGCGLHCKWCDTPYTHVFDHRKAATHDDGKAYDPRVELYRASVDEVARRILPTGLRTVAVTGGEPLLQQAAVRELIGHPFMERRAFEFETAGVIKPAALAGLPNVRFNVSPKLGNSGNTVSERRNPEAITALLRQDSVFKFVLDTRLDLVWQADLEEVLYLVREWEIPADRVWLMPCGTTPVAVTAGMLMLEPVCIMHGWNLSARLQVFMHGDERGF